MTEDYAITYCVKCKRKTEWCERPTLKRTRNNLNGLRGACNTCYKTKFTFVSNAYMQRRNEKSLASGTPSPPTATETRNDPDTTGCRK